MKNCFRAFLLLCLAFLLALPVQCAEYEYTVVFHAGNQGTFMSAENLEIESNTASVRVSSEEIRITGLHYGDRICFRAAEEGSVQLKESGKYYCKGFRISGRDIGEVAPESFLVTGDREFSAVYGSRRSLVAYTLQFQDQSGKALCASRVCCGAVGDKPVIACLYVAGYRPQSYNLTRTLRADPQENVFTFLYTPTSRSGTQVQSSPSAVMSGQSVTCEIPEILDLDETPVPSGSQFEQGLSIAGIVLPLTVCGSLLLHRLCRKKRRVWSA